MIIFRSIHHVYEYKICAHDYVIINIYNSTVSAGTISIAHNDNNNINFNILILILVTSGTAVDRLVTSGTAKDGMVASGTVRTRR